MLRKERVYKRYVAFAGLLIILLLSGCGDREMGGSSSTQETSESNQVAVGTQEKENDANLQEAKNTKPQLTATPTVCPNVPPYYVMVDGTLMQVKEGVEGDFLEYQMGTVTYTGDLFKLPEEDGQTNYSEYDGLGYAVKDGVWYMYFSGSRRDGGWCRLGPDE